MSDPVATGAQAAVAWLPFLLAQHQHSHAAVLSGSRAPLLSDRILLGLTPEQLRCSPAPYLNSIAWLLWHLARSEDILVNLLIGEREQVLDAGGWYARLGLQRCDIGTGNSRAEVAEVSAGVDLAALQGYRLAVGRQTLHTLSAIPAKHWAEEIRPERLLAANAFTDPHDGQQRVASYWQGSTRQMLATTALTTHNVEHLGEALCLRSILLHQEPAGR